MLDLSSSRRNGKPSACASGRQVRVCVCSDRPSEGRCAGSPWPLGMIPAACHI
jgi:hypothetical protein